MPNNTTNSTVANFIDPSLIQKPVAVEKPSAFINVELAFPLDDPLYPGKTLIRASFTKGTNLENVRDILIANVDRLLWKPSQPAQPQW
jgi:hypothetical protein